MKEIGGYFGLEQLISNEYYKNLIPLNNGRNSLLYLLMAKNIKKIYIPYYLCNSISDMLKSYSYDFEYYFIDSKFIPIINARVTDKEYIYIVNYFGQVSNETILSLQKQFKNIIIDNTHAFFQKPLSGIDTIYSCRKFFGVPDGAYLSTESRLSVKLDMDISKERMTHILGRFEGIASDYYNDFQNSDEVIAAEPLRHMSKLTHNILGAIDYEMVRQIRSENYVYLETNLGSYNKLKLISPEGAFAYPYYVENGIHIRKSLARNNIYIPTLWPNVLDDIPTDSIDYKYAANILPLPCDQRYGLEDMKLIIENIRYQQRG